MVQDGKQLKYKDYVIIHRICYKKKIVLKKKLIIIH